MTTTPREDRLPRWAQDALLSLRRQLSDAKAEREEARLASDPAHSSAIMDAYSDPPIGLGSDARVRFLLGDNVWVDMRVVNDQGDYSVNIIGSSTLGIYPRSSNALSLRVIRQ